MKLWIVEGYGGSYEDAREWQIKAFYDKRKAEAFAEKLRSGKQIDQGYEDYYKHIGEPPQYRVYQLPVGDKLKAKARP